MHTQDLPGIGQAQRARVLLHAGSGNTGDLQCHIRANPHHAMRRRVHDAEHFRGERRAGTFQQMLFEFNQGRFHLLIAVARKNLHQGTVDAGLARSRGREHICQTGGQQAFFGIVIHYVGL